MVQKNKALIATIAILIATVFWGMTFSFIKDAMASMTPFNFLFWRFGIASIILIGICWKKLVFNRVVLIHGLLLGLFLAATVVFQTIGLRYTEASTASFLTGLSVILVALFETLINKRWPSTYLIGATILAISGVALITLANGIDINPGDLWVILCAFCFASYILFAGLASRLHQSFTLTLLQSMIICAVAGFASAIGDEIVVPQHWNVWVAILFCSIFASVIAFLLQLHFQKYVSSTKTAIIFSLEPVFATITAAIYLHERLTWQFFIGAAMIFCAILFAEKRTKQKTIPQE